MTKQKHMNHDSHITIEVKLEKGSSFKHIVEIIGKDCSTVSKEILKHHIFERKGTYGRVGHHTYNLRMICATCLSKKPCWSCRQYIDVCSLYERFVCPKLYKPLYVCNCKDTSVENYIKKSQV